MVPCFHIILERCNPCIAWHNIHQFILFLEKNVPDVVFAECSDIDCHKSCMKNCHYVKYATSCHAIYLLAFLGYRPHLDNLKLNAFLRRKTGKWLSAVMVTGDSSVRDGGAGVKVVRTILVWPWNENVRTKQKQQTNGNRAIWLVYRTVTNARGFWLVKRTLGWKNFMLKNFLEINRYFALTSYCNTIGQSNDAFSILGFSLAGKRRGHVLIFSSIG